MCHWASDLTSLSLCFLTSNPGHACMLSHSVMSMSLSPHGTVGHQAPQFMGFSMQEYWSGLPSPPPEDLPDPGIEPESPASGNPLQYSWPGKSHGQGSLVGCSPWGHEESDRTEQLHFHFSLSCIGEGNGNPLQCSCLENPRDGRAWWAAVYGVAQSRTQLKRLSSSSCVSFIANGFFTH